MGIDQGPEREAKLIIGDERKLLYPKGYKLSSLDTLYIIQRCALLNGYDITLREAQTIWEEYSDHMWASFLPLESGYINDLWKLISVNFSPKTEDEGYDWENTASEFSTLNLGTFGGYMTSFSMYTRKYSPNRKDGVFESSISIPHGMTNQFMKSFRDNEHLQKLIASNSLHGEIFGYYERVQMSLDRICVTKPETSVINVVNVYKDNENDCIKVRFEFLETELAQRQKEGYIKFPDQYVLTPRVLYTYMDNSTDIIIRTFDLICPIGGQINDVNQ